ncbi:signal peptidase I [Candidatus Acetothermia bacterium]|nr:signal peptidase I [Candidatus Acetothermia bacterium]MBI3643068.1 signal peptidase I [Candidatus Acetothermia bacterium]
MNEDLTPREPEEHQSSQLISDSEEHRLDMGLPEPDLPISAAEDLQPRHKPFLSRLFNKAGLSTSPSVDWTFDWLQVLVIAGLLAWLTMSYGIVRMRVPTGSMVPTILEGDSFFVDKLTYLLGFQKPEPGDIVVFWHTESTLCRDGFLIWHWGEEKPCKVRYVKRLVAEGPADIRIEAGKIYVNGTMLTSPAFDRKYTCAPGSGSGPCNFHVDAEKYFVLGDCTLNSADSRYWGTFAKEEFIGEPFFRVWPFNRIGPMNSYLGSAPGPTYPETLKLLNQIHENCQPDW